MAPQSSHPWVVVGQVSGVYGVKGWVKVRSYTDPVENLLGYQPWWVAAAGGAWREAAVADARVQGAGIVAHLAGIDDRDAALRLVGCEVAVPRSCLPPPQSGDYYWADIIGLEVSNRAGAPLGKVEGLLATGANDVLVVKGERERLIPFVRGAVVMDIDIAAGRMMVDWEADY